MYNWESDGQFEAVLSRTGSRLRGQTLRSRTSCHGNFENLRKLEVRTHHSHSDGIYGYVWHDAQAILSAVLLPPSSSRRQIGGIWLRLW